MSQRLFRGLRVCGLGLALSFCSPAFAGNENDFWNFCRARGRPRRGIGGAHGHWRQPLDRAAAIAERLAGKINDETSEAFRRGAGGGWKAPRMTNDDAEHALRNRHSRLFPFHATSPSASSGP